MANLIKFDDLVVLVDEYEGMEELKFNGEDTVMLDGKSGFPKKIEIEDCGLVRMIDTYCKGVERLSVGADVIHCTHMEEAPKVIELTKPCKELWLNKMDVTGCKLEIAKGGENLYMGQSKGIEKGTDFSGFDRVELDDCEMTNCDSFKFKEGGRVSMVMCSHFPKKLDLSALQSVDLRGADLSGVEEIIFREGAVVNLNGVKNLPRCLDLSKCAEVSVRNTDLAGVEELIWGEDSVIDISGSKNFPRVLDISKCKDVSARKTDLTGVKKIVYKDNEQANKFVNEVDYSTYPVVRIGPSYDRDDR